MTKVPFVHSNYPRRADDNYQTIDPRCTDSLLEYIHPGGRCVDICAPDGSGIAERLQELGFPAVLLPDAFAQWDYHDKDWIVTNPPYERPIVDTIIRHAVELVEDGYIAGAAFLLRTSFDHAKNRAALFAAPGYHGQIKLRYRPWWSEERKAQPIHNYVWHLWMKDRLYLAPPIVLYSNGE